VKPVASRYIDYAIPAPMIDINNNNTKEEAQKCDVMENVCVLFGIRVLKLIKIIAFISCYRNPFDEYHRDFPLYVFS
jgi:hypothetical protein